MTSIKIFLNNHTKIKTREHKGKSIIALPSDYCIIDIESTGLDPTYDEIIEVAALKVRENKIIDRYENLIRPTEEIPDLITQLTGITQDKLNHALPKEEILPEFFNFIKEELLIAHNANFDMNFLYDHLEALGYTFTNNFVDTLRISRKLLKEQKHHRLQDLKQLFGLDSGIAHCGLQDCEDLKLIFDALKHLAFETFGSEEAFSQKYFRNFTAKRMKREDVSLNEKHLLYGQHCTFTGALGRMVRWKAAQLVMNIGGFVDHSVTKKTNFLIVGNNDYRKNMKDGKSTKQKKAEKLQAEGQDIHVISEGVFYSLFDDVE